MNLLILAYAASPLRGTEWARGWNLPLELAKRGNRVHVITSPETVRECQDRAMNEGVQNLTFSCVRDWSPPFRRASRSGAFLTYAGWLVSVARYVKREGHKYDLIHHLTYASILLGSLIHKPGPPYVFGPVGGGQTMPPLLRRHLNDGVVLELLRAWLYGRLFDDWPLSRRVLRNADLVLACNEGTRQLLKRNGGQRVEVISELVSVRKREDLISARETFDPRRVDGTFLWVGRLIGRKAPDLALRALKVAHDKGAHPRLVFIGDGPMESALKNLAADLRLNDFVVFSGRRDWNDVLEKMTTAEGLLFTSLRETGGAQLMESLSVGLPAIYLKHAGNGASDLLNEAVSLIVDVDGLSFDQATAAFGEALYVAASSQQFRKTKVDACFELAMTRTWPEIAGQYEKHYKRVRRSNS